MSVVSRIRSLQRGPFFRVDDLVRAVEMAKDCSAGEEGAPGFQEGNACGAGDGRTLNSLNQSIKSMTMERAAKLNADFSGGATITKASEYYIEHGDKGLVEYIDSKGGPDETENEFGEKFQDFSAAAKLLVDQVRIEPITSKTLFRGIGSKNPISQFENARVGDSLEEKKLTSYTEAKDSAAFYAGDKHSYLIEVRGPSQTLSVDRLTGKAHKEHLTFGNYRVVEVRKGERVKLPRAYKGSTKFKKVIVVEQVNLKKAEGPETRPSCLHCVEKHLGAAMVLMGEERDGYEYRLRIIGHLHEAEDEAQEYDELHEAIRDARKKYQDKDEIPDWERLAGMMQKLQKNCRTGAGGFQEGNTCGAGGSGGEGQTPRRTEKEFRVALNTKFPKGLFIFHETTLDRVPGIASSGLRDEANFGTIGEPSGFITTKDKAIVRIRVPNKDYRKIIPDQRYNPENPYGDLMHEHSDLKGANVAIDGGIGVGTERGTKLGIHSITVLEGGKEHTYYPPEFKLLKKDTTQLPSTPYRMEKARLGVEAPISRAIEALAADRLASQRKRVLALLMRKLRKADSDPADDPGISDEELFDALADTPLPDSFDKQFGAAVTQGGDLQASQMKVNWREEDPDVQKFIRERKSNLEKVMDEATATEVKRALAQGRLESETEKELIERLEGLGIFGKARAQRIARTESHLAVMKGAHEAMVQNGVTHRQWLASLDERTRPAHLEANGQVVAIDEPYIVDNEELMFPGDPEGSPGNIINCILPGNKVWGEFLGASKAFYSGKAVEIVTRRGERLTLTVNHPVLTVNGLVSAGALKKCDRLLRYCGDFNALSLRDPDQKNSPVPVEDIFNALARDSRPRNVMVGDLEFHGDAQGFEAKVSVVSANRALRSDLMSCLQEELLKLPLIETSSRPCSFHSDGASQPNRKRFLLALLPSSSPCTVTLPLDESSIETEFVPFESLDLAHRPDPDTSFKRPCPRPSSINACLFLYLLKRCALSVKPDDFLKDSLRARFPVIAIDSQLNAVLQELVPQRLSFNFGSFRKLIERYPGFVETDEILYVRHFDYSGHVYDLETVSGLIINEKGITYSNCRCTELVRRDIETTDTLGDELELNWEDDETDEDIEEKIREAVRKLPRGQTAGLDPKDVDSLGVKKIRGRGVDYDPDEGLIRIGSKAPLQQIQNAVRQHLVATEVSPSDARGFINQLRAAKLPEPTSGTETQKAVRALSAIVAQDKATLETLVGEKIESEEWARYKAVGAHFWVNPGTPGKPPELRAPRPGT
jgi:SPP1 gp7 family putative phage head morphogenesis protein